MDSGFDVSLVRLSVLRRSVAVVLVACLQEKLGVGGGGKGPVFLCFRPYGSMCV